MLSLNRRGIQKAVSAYEADHIHRYGDLYTYEQLTRLRHAAVMLPLFVYNNEWHLLLTQRADTLVEHRGQVAFPGGGHEQQDKDLRETALREMHEEIGVEPEDVHVFGHLGDLPVVTGYLVRPYVGQIPWPYTFYLAKEEVHSVFSIPISWLAAPENHQVHFRSVAGREFPVIYFELYDGYQLWGASAEMAMALLSALNLIR
jgi:8-oxo-dGTP pyrophosphatase MutT (NUDIX family)